jgi:hypothetical protein
VTAASPVPSSFARALAVLWARDGIHVENAASLAETIATAFSSGREGVRRASDLLDESGVRARWNDVLRQQRAAALAARIRPLIRGRLLDVLSGDGSVCRALADLGVADIAATERAGDYSQASLPGNATFAPFTDALDLSTFGADTALLSAVLHHEPDPIRLLNRLAHAGIARWIVVENCVTPEFSQPFHRFADEFFNSCLNEFGVSCVDQHRTLEEWTEVLSHFGAVTVIDPACATPGIPFPYAFLVVDR